jgi:hypothetical protein
MAPPPRSRSWIRGIESATLRATRHIVTPSLHPEIGEKVLGENGLSHPMMC